MTTMTVEAISKFTRSNASSGSGAYRTVYFFGDDLVIKDDGCEFGNNDWSANTREYENYQTLAPATLVTDEGFKFHVKFPKTEMVGGYIIAQRVKFPHARDAMPCSCAIQKRREVYWNKRDACWAVGDYRGANDIPRPEHAKRCKEYKMRSIARTIGKHYDLEDLHGGNWMFDKDTNTVWVIDFAD